MSPFLRHIQACNNAELPGERRPFRVSAQQVGWVMPDLATALVKMAGISVENGTITLADAARLPDIARAAASLGFGRMRNEAFDVRATPTGPVIAAIDRGALPVFGIAAQGVHLDGLVRKNDGLHLWIGKRAANKALDPGKLDHIVAGGIPAGLTPWQTLVKEADEEASIPEPLLTQAHHYATIHYAMARHEGLRRDILHCYEVELPPDFTPTPADGEVESFTLMPLSDIRDIIEHTDDFKFNVNVVLLALLLRHNVIIGQDAAELRSVLAIVGN